MKNKIKHKYMESPFITIGLIFMIILGYSCGFFILFYPALPGNEAIGFTLYLGIFITFILSTLTFIFLIHRGASIIEINEQGIKKSLFKVFYNREIK